MALAIILVVLIVIVGVTALVVKLFSLEEQFRVFLRKFFRFSHKILSCFLMGVRFLGVMLGLLFIHIFSFLKKIFTKKKKDKSVNNDKDLKENEQEIEKKEKKNKEKNKIEKGPIDKKEEKSDRVVRQFSNTRPVLLPPKDEEEKEIDEELEKNNEIAKGQNIEPADFSAKSEMNRNFREGLPIDSTNDTNLFEVNLNETERYGQEQERQPLNHFSFYSSPNQREIEENKKSLNETLAEIRAQMEKDLYVDRDEFQKDSPHYAEPHSPTPLYVEPQAVSPQYINPQPATHSYRLVRSNSEQDKPKRNLSVFDFSGKNSLKPRAKVSKEDSKKIDLNNIPESVKKEIIEEYFKKKQEN